MLEWSPDPSVPLGCVLLAGAYLICIGPRRGHFPGSEAVPRRRITAFLSGVALLWLALGTPLDTLSDRYLLSAHMVQHMLLTLIMPPLLLLGTPGWLLRPALRSPLVEAPASFLTRPLVAFALFNLTIAVSHLPIIYNFTLEDHRAHVLEHLAYMVTAVITWWPILSPLPELPRLSYPLQMLYVFFQTVPGALVGSLVTLANEVLYPVYAAAPRVSGLSPMADQQLGGLIMWIGSSTYFFILLTIIFFVWASHEETPTLLQGSEPRA
jgi:putative membrane protein